MKMKAAAFLKNKYAQKNSRWVVETLIEIMQCLNFSFDIELCDSIHFN